MNKTNTNLIYAKLPKVSGYDLLVFLIWPFALLIHRLKDIKDPKSKTVFWLFCVYFGFAFIIQEDVEGAADSARYASNLKIMNEEGNSLEYISDRIYNIESADLKLDFYETIITWLVSLFTSNAQILFTVFSAVFGFFYVQNLWIIFSKLKKTKGLFIGVLILYLILILPIWQVNGVRMWTAAHIYIYGILLFHLSNKKKSGYFWILASFLVHFSFIFPAIIFIISRFIRLKINILIILYLVAFILDNVDLDFIKNISSYLPNILGLKVEEYASEGYNDAFNKRLDEKSLIFQINKFITSFFIFLWVLLLYAKRKSIKIDLGRDFYNFFKFILLFGVFAQFASLIPSGGRFLTIFHFMIYGILLIVVSNYILKTNKIIFNIFVPFLMYLILFKIRIGSEFFGMFLFFGNPITSFIVEDEVNLITLIRKAF
ncbi:EpsG family protein [Psychroflexus montanilacus]|uniref:EpsG family protein n=1 Tax=Psychroflexus montanilacus TaxID=2873598 RepID=UPI001CC911F5|nr:EpsG family protein [Psychroflexus montanilacus]MBZ9652572.1 EpsG family protein [Psychroflexus montanilacus]